MKNLILLFVLLLPTLATSCNEEVDPYQDQEFDFREDPNDTDDTYYPPYYPYEVNKENKK